MSPEKTLQEPLRTQIWHFIIHLRWHYQVFILSGGFLLGGYLSMDMDWTSFILQFGNVHLLLFGGATAYNSYWDKDRGPIGGLRHPPRMHHWMLPISLLLQFIGLFFALFSGLFFTLIYGLSILFFWLYSSPHFRWKGSPLLSLIAIGLSTGTNSLLMGYLSAGNRSIEGLILIAALGVALIVLSLYPLSQLFQLDDDRRRGDETFAITFGFSGVIRFFQAAFAGGLILLGFSIALRQWWAGAILVIIGAITGYWIYGQLSGLKREADDYPRVMRIKYATSMAFLSFIIVLLVFKHVI